RIFSSEEMAKFLSGHDCSFSSANSINFGRLVPQIVYYVSAYCDMVTAGRIKQGDPINVAVPTGNFGDILAAYYAKEMGVPIARFICASNSNNVLTDFIRTGTYNRNRPFHTTISPSMDILVSSNLERLLYHLLGGNCETVAELMKKLATESKYKIPEKALKQLQSEFYGAYCDEDQTKAAIGDMYKKGYLCDPHTAVAVGAYRQYLKETGDYTPVVIASTASPFKFSGAVLESIGCTDLPDDEFARVELLAKLTKQAIPAPIAALRNGVELHKSVVAKEEMDGFIRDFIAR
ncbi:MAG: hypothetical protein MJ025_06480, partial [Victivallaceae bacterium]|nr:hypothetical protein [Victivallaceae bacterium]